MFNGENHVFIAFPDEQNCFDYNFCFDLFVFGVLRIAAKGLFE